MTEMLTTKIKATVYAARLRKRLAELKKKRPAELKAYNDGVAKWRRDLSAWIKTNAAKRVVDLKPKREKSRWRGETVMFEYGSFFEGAPNPPEWPSDRQIRDIHKLLRHLGITGQETIQVSTEEVTQLFGDPDAADDD